MVGVVLAFVFRGGAQEDWEGSHYSYHIKTFWLFALAVAFTAIAVISVIAEVAIGGFVALPAAALAILAGVRSVLAMINAVQKEPMPKPNSWLI